MESIRLGVVALGAMSFISIFIHFVFYVDLGSDKKYHYRCLIGSIFFGALLSLLWAFVPTEETMARMKFPELYFRGDK